MNNLQMFLAQTSIDNLTKEVDLGGRLKGQPFTIRAISGVQYNEFQKLCLENPNSAKKRSFNTKKFNELVIVAGTVNPNFKDPEFQQAAGVPHGDAVGLMYKTLLPGEIAQLTEQILSLSGFNQDTMEEAIEEAKN